MEQRKRLRVPANARPSKTMDYREIVPEYERFVAEVGKTNLTRAMDEMFYALEQSSKLVTEPELADWQFPLDDFDWILEEALRIISAKPSKRGEWSDDYRGLILVGLHRDLTPYVIRHLKRRLAKIETRLAGTQRAIIASDVRFALDDAYLRLFAGLAAKLYSDTICNKLLAREQVVEAEKKSRDPRINALIAQIKTGSFKKPARAAVETLIKIGPAVLPALEELAYEEGKTPDDYSVVAAFEAIARIPCPRAVTILVYALEDDWESIIQIAQKGLTQMKDLAKDYLVYLAQNPEARIYTTGRVYEILRAIEEPETFTLIVRGLESKEWLVQIEAADNLIQLGDRRAIEPILKLLQEKKWKGYDIRTDVVDLLQESAWWEEVKDRVPQ